MNFEVEYTPEQERFRQEVRQWLQGNVPAGITATPAAEGPTEQQYRLQRALGRRLGEKGWLYPLAPSGYGGGGMDIDHAIILEEEMERIDLNLPPYYDSGGRLGGASIQVWGSEEQKRHFLPAIYRGEVRTWQLLTEPSAGSDLASVQTRAIRDGDDYVLNGIKMFVGSNHGADRHWMIAVTDPTGPRHQNVSWFMVDAGLPGITYQGLDLLSPLGGETGAHSGLKNTVFFEDVRVPAFCLIGGENNGWKVASTHLELEHGGGGNVRASRIWGHLLDYCRTHGVDGVPIVEHPEARAVLTDIFVDVEITRLYGLRNYYLANSGKPRSYEGPQLYMQRKLSDLRIAGLIQKVLGYSALVTDAEYSAEEGHIEMNQRTAIVGLHPGATVEIQKLIMSRRIGIGSTVREEAGALT